MSAASDIGYYHDGFVLVLTGAGDGTFTPGGKYPTAYGPISVVLGDFTRDGTLDVATANRSFRYVDDLCNTTRQGSDSVSILPGNGDGTFGKATSFALGSQAVGATPFVDEADALNTADVNRDGHQDLVVSDGRVLLTTAPRANRAPVVDAGEDVSEQGGNSVVLRGGATNPDGHWLQLNFTGAIPVDGNVPAGVGCVEGLAPERHVLTLTADDGHVQATDTVVIDFRYTDPGPEGWTRADIGAVAAAGSSVFREGEYTITGSGADIWDRADEFHFVSTAVSGDFSIYARVSSIDLVHRWTKAGLMIREGKAPGARHASLFVTPSTEKGIAFQRRQTVDGLSVHTPGPALTAPVWIMLKRTGDVISAYYQATGPLPGWILIGRDVLTGLPDTLDVGLAVTSHADGRLATARFSDVLISGPDDWGLVTSDIGAVGQPGTVQFGSGSTRIQEGSGADIWGTADAFQFSRKWWTADATATVHVQSIEATDPWAKLGLMFRETLDPGSRHVMLIASAERGLAMQYRAQPGGISRNVALSPGTAPVWLRLTRAGNIFTGYASEDGATWRTIGSIALPLDLDTYVGVALTSHDNSELASGVYDSFTLVR